MTKRYQHLDQIRLWQRQQAPGCRQPRGLWCGAADDRQDDGIRRCDTRAQAWYSIDKNSSFNLTDPHVIVYGLFLVEIEPFLVEIEVVFELPRTTGTGWPSFIDSS